MTIAAFVEWPSAPLTNSLVLRALQRTVPHSIVDNIEDRTVEQSILQWSSYDAIDHEATLRNTSTTLSSSYTIRKALIRKHFLHRCITAYTTKHPESCLLSSVPPPWDIEISFADELDESG